MATDLNASAVLDPHERPVLLHGIRWSTFETILDDLGDRRTGLAYNNGQLSFKTSVLYDIRWSTFEAILDDLGDHRGVRLAYNQGRLEFMSPSRSHDSWKKSTGRIVEVFTLERRIPMCSGGSLTLRRGDLARGVEPDECYWIASEAAVRGRRELDLTIDPPPDLVIEVDVSHSSLPSLEIYAALGVPEVWRVVNESILIHHLQADGTYATRPDSPSLPGLTAADVERFVSMGDTVDETTWMLAFRDWVRAEVMGQRRDPEP